MRDAARDTAQLLAAMAPGTVHTAESAREFWETLRASITEKATRGECPHCHAEQSPSDNTPCYRCQAASACPDLKKSLLKSFSRQFVPTP